MKKLIVLCFVLIAACKSHDASPGTTVPAGSGAGVKIAVTEFALWRGPNGDLNGKYDAQEGMFIPCGSDHGQAVDKRQITALSGDCNGRPGKPEPEIHLVERNGDNFTVISHNVTLQDMNKGTATYQTPTGSKQLILDESTTRRLRANPVLLQKYRQK